MMVHTIKMAEEFPNNDEENAGGVKKTKSNAFNTFKTEFFRPFSKREIFANCLLIILLILWSYSIRDEIRMVTSMIGNWGPFKYLPSMNWSPFQESKCVVDRASLEQAIRALEDMEKCQSRMTWRSLDNVPTGSKNAFSKLLSTYLQAELPLKITDSHAPVSLANLMKAIDKKAPHYGISRPCNIETDVIAGKPFHLRVAFDVIRNASETSEWFLQLRNCQKKSVEDFHLFAPPPDYYPTNLEAVSSSWLLMTQNSAINKHHLKLQRKVIVQQFSGQYDITLSEKTCEAYCQTYDFFLKAGEALIFSADFWKLDYDIKEPLQTPSIATIMEIDAEF